MTRDLIVQIGNDLLKNQGNLNTWMELISDYVNEKDKSKTDIILKIFPSLPQPTQVQLLQIALKYFGKKFAVCSLGKETENNSWIINGVPQKTTQIFCYF